MDEETKAPAPAPAPEPEPEQAEPTLEEKIVEPIVIFQN